MGDMYDLGGPPPPPPPVDPVGPVPPTPPGGPLDEDARWRRAVFIALGLAAAGILAVVIAFLATRGGNSPPAALTSPSASATPSPSASPSPSPTDTPSPTPTPTATPTATPKPTPAPTVAPPPSPAQQATVLFPSGGIECGGTGDYSSCPVTQALVNAAEQWRTNHNPSSPAPLCRCPIAYTSPLAQRNDALLPAGYQGNPGYAAVNVSLTFPPSGHEDMVVVFARQGNGTWLAIDTYCVNPQNRLTSANPQLCS